MSFYHLQCVVQQNHSGLNHVAGRYFTDLNSVISVKSTSMMSALNLSCVYLLPSFCRKLKSTGSVHCKDISQVCCGFKIWNMLYKNNVKVCFKVFILLTSVHDCLVFIDISSLFFSPVSLAQGRILPWTCQVHEQPPMAETEQDRTLLPARGAGLSAEAGEIFWADFNKHVVMSACVTLAINEGCSIKI